MENLRREEYNQTNQMPYHQNMIQQPIQQNTQNGYSVTKDTLAILPQNYGGDHENVISSNKAKQQNYSRWDKYTKQFIEKDDPFKEQQKVPKTYQAFRNNQFYDRQNILMQDSEKTKQTISRNQKIFDKQGGIQIKAQFIEPKKSAEKQKISEDLNRQKFLKIQNLSEHNQEEQRNFKAADPTQNPSLNTYEDPPRSPQQEIKLQETQRSKIQASQAKLHAQKKTTGRVQSYQNQNLQKPLKKISTPKKTVDGKQLKKNQQELTNPNQQIQFPPPQTEPEKEYAQKQIKNQDEIQINKQINNEQKNQAPEIVPANQNSPHSNLKASKRILQNFEEVIKQENPLQNNESQKQQRENIKSRGHKNEQVKRLQQNPPNSQDIFQSQQIDRQNGDQKVTLQKNSQLSDFNKQKEQNKKAQVLDQRKMSPDLNKEQYEMIVSASSVENLNGDVD